MSVKIGGYTFSSKFDGGNLGKVSHHKSRDNFEVSPFSDPFKQKPHLPEDLLPSWFYFSITPRRGTPPGTVNISVSGLAPNCRSQPVVRSHSNSPWEGLKDAEVSVTGDTASVSFSVRVNKSAVFVAAARPYTCASLKATLDELEEQHAESIPSNVYFWRENVIPINRKCNMELIHITHRSSDLTKHRDQKLRTLFPDGRKHPRPRHARNRKVVFVFARMIPSDAASSFMVDELLRFLCSPDECAVELRKKFIFQIVPMANPDGVMSGFSKTNAKGILLDDDFGQTKKSKNPATYALKLLIRRLHYEDRLGYVFDVRGSALADRAQILPFSASTSTFADQVARSMLARLLAINLNHSRISSVELPHSGDTNVHRGRLIHREFEFTDSFFLYLPGSLTNDIHDIEHCWREVGIALARSVLDMYEEFEFSQAFIRLGSSWCDVWQSTAAAMAEALPEKVETMSLSTSTIRHSRIAYHGLSSVVLPVVHFKAVDFTRGPKQNQHFQGLGRGLDGMKFRFYRTPNILLQTTLTRHTWHHIRGQRNRPVCKLLKAERRRKRERNKQGLPPEVPHPLDNVDLPSDEYSDSPATGKLVLPPRKSSATATETIPPAVSDDTSGAVSENHLERVAQSGKGFTSVSTESCSTADYSDDEEKETPEEDRLSDAPDPSEVSALGIGEQRHGDDSDDDSEPEQEDEMHVLADGMHIDEVNDESTMHTPGGNWTLCWWGVHPPPSFLWGMNRFQKVNHFPNSFNLTDKDYLADNIAKMRDRNGKEAVSFVPESFVLPRDEEIIRQHMESEPGAMWIYKPAEGRCGNDIKIVKRFEDIPRMEFRPDGTHYEPQDTQGDDREAVVQRYIGNPYLIKGVKFDFRLYCLVTSFTPLRVFVLENGLGRFCVAKYGSGDITDPSSHLTNVTLNKKHRKFKENKDAAKDNVGTVWSVNAVKKHMRDQGVDVEGVFASIHDLIIKTLIAVEPPLREACQSDVPYDGNAFELYGFDVLVDDNLKPWLIEANSFPSLACRTPMDLDIKSHLLAELLTIVGMVPHYFRGDEDENEPVKEKSERKTRARRGSTTELSANAGYTSYSSYTTDTSGSRSGTGSDSGSSNGDPEPQPPNEIKYPVPLRDVVRAERLRCRQFAMIYPTPDNRYKHLFAPGALHYSQEDLEVIFHEEQTPSDADIHVPTDHHETTGWRAWLPGGHSPRNTEPEEDPKSIVTQRVVWDTSGHLGGDREGYSSDDS